MSLSRRIVRYAIAAGIAALLPGALLAQPASPDAAGEIPATQPAGGKDTDSATQAAAQQATDQEVQAVPDKRKQPRADEALARMREILKDVLEHLEEARDEKDVVKLNCVNEKLTAIKGLLKISEQASVTMQEALARRNSENARHEFEKIIIAQRKSEQLLAESEACVGELAVYAGDTQVEVVMDDVPEDDPAENIPDVETVERPPAASPYQ
mgnify:CR=1 FL=1